MATPLPALLLTAGLGTRLDPLTRLRAKPAVPVGGEALARHVVRWLVGSGITDITCNLHHLPHTISAVLGDGSDLGASIRYSWEQPLLLGSAGGPRQALDIVGADRFLLVNGDTLTDVSLDDLSRAHQSSGARVTLALVPNVAPDRYGGVILDETGAVTGFTRRGRHDRSSFHFVGVQIVESEIFFGLAVGVAASTVGGLYDQLIAAAPGSIRGVVLAASFFDVGTLADYQRASAAFSKGRRDVGARVDIAASAQVTQSIFWDDVSIGADVRLDRCVVTDGVHVPAGQAYDRVVLLSGADDRLLTVPIPEAS